MREILFRGKRVDNGEWVEGFYEQTYTYDTNKQLHRILWNDEQTKTAFCADIIPESLGQFTGLTDKNGKQIWEGDIVSYNEEIETRSLGKETLKGVYEVKFEYCGFDPLDCLACNHLEVIGNIHDNPELLTAERSEK